MNFFWKYGVKLLVALSPVLVLAKLVPRVSDERFGVMTHFAQGWDPERVALLAEGRVGHVRDELYWDSVEQEKGVYKFPEFYDRYLSALEKTHISPLIVLSFENRNYDGGSTPYTQEGFDGYARYAVEVLRRCGQQVRAVEIWNEYNGTFNRGPAGEDRTGNYLKMLRTVYGAIKRERPDVTVVGGATIGIPLPYWEKILAGGGLDFMDALSVHPYRYGSPPEGLEKEIARLQELVRKYNHGKNKPVWVTEIGWYIKPSKAPGDLLIDERVQADFLVRAYALLLSAGVQRIYWYLLLDHQEFTMGLAHNDSEQTRKPAYFALSTLIRQLADAHFVRREKTSDDLYSLLFQRVTGEEVRILWSLTRRPLVLKDSIKALDVTGKPVPLGGLLTLNDSPLFVTGPLRGLPPSSRPEGAVLADSAEDFGPTPKNGWSYGLLAQGSNLFTPLPHYTLTDWKGSWTGGSFFISITAEDQHPSVTDNAPVTAVRRWQSSYQGRVRITGSYRCGTEGDGVGVSFSVNGERRFRELLGGGAAVVKNFELIEDVQPGTILDFEVDPGPGTSVDFDGTAVAIVIRQEPFDPKLK